jgi:hypothetical protein
MSVILLTLGIVMALAGIATVGFGIPINEFAFITAGATALTGGLVLVGLAAVVSELARVAEGLKARPVATRPTARAAEAAEPVASPAPPATAPVVTAPPPVAPAPNVRPVQDVVPAAPPRSPRPEPQVREVRPPLPEPYPPAPAAPAPSTVEVSAAAIERLRSSIPRTERPAVEIEEVPLSPNGTVHAPAAPPPRRPAPEVSPPEPKVTAEERPAGTAVEALKASRLDFLFRSKQPARPAPQPQAENFDAFWPADARQGRSAPAEAAAQPNVDQVERQATATAPVQERRPEPTPPPAEEPRTAAILKSGVVDGMAYTLYADGSIEAQLPQGTVRFGSIAELRAHIGTNS